MQESIARRVTWRGMVARGLEQPRGGVRDGENAVKQAHLLDKSG